MASTVAHIALAALVMLDFCNHTIEWSQLAWWYTVASPVVTATHVVLAVPRCNPWTYTIVLVFDAVACALGSVVLRDLRDQTPGGDCVLQLTVLTSASCAIQAVGAIVLGGLGCLRAAPSAG